MTKQQNNKTTKQQKNKTTKQQNNKTTKQQNSKTTKQQNNKTTKQQNNKTTKQQNNKKFYVGFSNLRGGNILYFYFEFKICKVNEILNRAILNCNHLSPFD